MERNEMQMRKRGALNPGRAPRGSSRRLLAGFQQILKLRGAT
jgi:hypothetical protein